MTTTPSTRNRSIAVVAGVLLIALLAGGAWLLFRPADDPAVATQAPAAASTPADVAAAFAAAYATGDIPTACSYAAGTAVEKLNRNGWCQQKQQWNVQYWQTGTCTLPTGEVSFNYGTSSEIDGQRGFEVGITAAGPDQVYKVTTFIKRNNTSPSLCGIYATKSSAG